MRLSQKALCWAISCLLLCHTVLATPILVSNAVPRLARYSRSTWQERQDGARSTDSHIREKRVVKTVITTVGSGIKGASVAGLTALGRASAGTVGLVGKASAGTLSAVGSASLGAVGAASGLGAKAIGSASSLGAGAAKSLAGVSATGVKTVGAAGAKVAVKTGFTVAKAAVTVGIAKFILSLILGKINQLLGLKNSLAGTLGVSNLKSNNLLSVSSSSSSGLSSSSSGLASSSTGLSSGSSGSSSNSGSSDSADGEPDDEDLPEINPDQVSLQVPDAFFSKGFNVVNKASPVIGEVVQNTAERAARLIQNAKPLLTSSLFKGSRPEPAWNVEVEDDVPILEDS